MNPYDVISGVLNEQADDEARQWYRCRYVYATYIKNSVCIISILVVAAAWFLGAFSWAAWIVLLALALVFVLFVLYGQMTKVSLLNILNKQCDPVLFARRWLALLEGCEDGRFVAYRPELDQVTFLYRYAWALRWQGRWVDATALMRVCNGRLSRLEDEFVYHHLMVGCAFDCGDVNTLSTNVAALCNLPSAELKQEYVERIEQDAKLVELLQCELSGQMDKAFEGYASIANDLLTYKLRRVLASFKAAGCTPDAKERQKCLEFAAKNGGTSWCAIRARELLKEENRLE